MAADGSSFKLDFHAVTIEITLALTAERIGAVV